MAANPYLPVSTTYHPVTNPAALPPRKPGGGGGGGPQPQVGSPAWLLSAPSNAVAAWMATIQPDYRGVHPVDPKAAASYAQEQTDKYMQPYLDQKAADQARLDSQRQQSLAAGTSFYKALSDIITGGQSGEAGQQYALKTFGGSFLGELQTSEGMKMFVDVTRDFNAQDQALADRYAQVLDKRPDIYQQLFSDFVSQEQANQKAGISLANSDFEHRMKAAALILANTQKREANLAKAMGSSQYTYRSLANGQLAVIDNATGKQVGTIGQPRATKPTKRQTSWQTINGQRVLVDNQTGAVIRTAGKAGTTKAKTSVVAKARNDALSLARSLWTQKKPPTGQAAGDALWTQFGEQMLAAGVSRDAAIRVIAAVVRSASAGAWVWDPNKMGPQAPGGASSSNPFTGG